MSGTLAIDYRQLRLDSTWERERPLTGERGA
jgi:hypothetical protein